MLSCWGYSNAQQNKTRATKQTSAGFYFPKGIPLGVGRFSLGRQLNILLNFRSVRSGMLQQVQCYIIEGGHTGFWFQGCWGSCSIRLGWGLLLPHIPSWKHPVVTEKSSAALSIRETLQHHIAARLSSEPTNHQCRTQISATYVMAMQ